MDTEEKFVAAKGGFNTANRRFAEGQILTRAEVEAGDRDFDVLRHAGFIVGYDTKAADKAAQHAKEADGLILPDSPEPTPPPRIDPPATEPEPPAAPEIKRPSRR